MGAIQRAMTDGEFYRMQTFNQALAKLVHESMITEEEAMKTTSNPNELQAMLRGILTGSATVARKTAEPGDTQKGLKITKGY
jgi:Tfp pilus assembly ATPase PilU